MGPDSCQGPGVEGPCGNLFSPLLTRVKTLTTSAKPRSSPEEFMSSPKRGRAVGARRGKQPVLHPPPAPRLCATSPSTSNKNHSPPWAAGSAALPSAFLRSVLPGARSRIRRRGCAVTASTTELPPQLWRLRLVPSLLTGCSSQLLLLCFKTDPDQRRPEEGRESGSSRAGGWPLYLVVGCTPHLAPRGSIPLSHAVKPCRSGDTQHPFPSPTRLRCTRRRLGHLQLSRTTGPLEESSSPLREGGRPGDSSPQEQGDRQGRDRTRQPLGATPGSWGCCGHGQDTLPAPPGEAGAAANNPSIESPLAPAHLRFREPGADKDNVSRWRALPRRGRQTGLCICRGQVSFREKAR